MSKSLAPLFALLGSLALAAACSPSTNTGTPLPNNNNSSGSGNNLAGTNPGPVGGSSVTAGSSGLPSAGNSSMGGASATGGTGMTAGTTSGGTSPTGGSSPAGGSVAVAPGEGPPGYWVEKDWHGCSWTGIESTAMTMRSPMDFTTKDPAAAFCLKGTVAADPMYNSVALLGFNVDEAPPATCAYKAADPNASGPPSVVPTADGLAVNFIKQGADTSFTLRVQIQGPDGAKAGAAGAADRWCATLVETQGKIFVPWASFTPSCWETTAALRGTPYAKQPISAVVFNVPGKLTATPFDFCVNGFTYGTMASDAPDGPAVAGDQKGTVGSNVSPDGDFARAKVVVGGKSYLIQNNNWGNPTGTDLILSYVNNSFKITSGSGSGDVPVDLHRQQRQHGQRRLQHEGVRRLASADLGHHQPTVDAALQRLYRHVQRHLRHLVCQQPTDRRVQGRHQRLHHGLVA
jgi:hypothetical protein